jgi:hypothetical protein
MKKIYELKKLNSNSKYLNSLLSLKLSEANKALINLQYEKKDASANQIKKKRNYIHP